MRVFLQLMFDFVDRNPRKLPRGALRQLFQFRLGQQGHQQMRAADGRRRHGQRSDQPRMLQQQRQMAREHRRARAPGLELADFMMQVRFQRLHAHPAFVSDHQYVAALLLQQGQEQVLHFHLVLAECHADAGRAAGGQAGGVVQFSDQRFQIVHVRPPRALR
ncbi:conserved hypothetical protein [Ricinus communis]|uniref:Uncharacterized protein n=1 Tax=Ricinus communis TaxID=3988 RepID=B9TI88_RICCO|nr:conserved hypothetical protein [Ricinus communis]